MNERIRELAARAGVLTDWGDDITVGRWGISGNYERMQEFALLIVKECLVQIGDAIPDTDCSASGAYKTAKIAAMAKVKDHFGVE